MGVLDLFRARTEYSAPGLRLSIPVNQASPLTSLSLKLASEPKRLAIPKNVARQQSSTSGASAIPIDILYDVLEHLSEYMTCQTPFSEVKIGSILRRTLRNAAAVNQQWAAAARPLLWRHIDLPVVGKQSKYQLRSARRSRKWVRSIRYSYTLDGTTEDFAAFEAIPDTFPNLRWLSVDLCINATSTDRVPDSRFRSAIGTFGSTMARLASLDYLALRSAKISAKLSPGVANWAPLDPFQLPPQFKGNLRIDLTIPFTCSLPTAARSLFLQRAGVTALSQQVYGNLRCLCVTFEPRISTLFRNIAQHCPGVEQLWFGTLGTHWDAYYSASSLGFLSQLRKLRRLACGYHPRTIEAPQHLPPSLHYICILNVNAPGLQTLAAADLSHIRTVVIIDNPASRKSLPASDFTRLQQALSGLARACATHSTRFWHGRLEGVLPDIPAGSKRSSTTIDRQAASPRLYTEQQGFYLDAAYTLLSQGICPDERRV